MNALRLIEIVPSRLFEWRWCAWEEGVDGPNTTLPRSGAPPPPPTGAVAAAAGAGDSSAEAVVSAGECSGTLRVCDGGVDGAVPVPPAAEAEAEADGGTTIERRRGVAGGVCGAGDAGTGGCSGGLEPDTLCAAAEAAAAALPLSGWSAVGCGCSERLPVLLVLATAPLRLTLTSRSYPAPVPVPEPAPALRAAEEAEAVSDALVKLENV